MLIPQEPFELLVRRSIKTLLEPAIKCKDFVQEELLRIANESFPRELSRFVSLQKKLLDATSEFIRAGGLPAEEMIKNLIDCEYDYINYDHADFIGGSNAVAEVLSDRNRPFPQRPSDARSSSQNGQTSAPMQYPPVVLRNLRNPVMESIGAPLIEPGLKVAHETDPSCTMGLSVFLIDGLNVSIVVLSRTRDAREILSDFPCPFLCAENGLSLPYMIL